MRTIQGMLRAFAVGVNIHEDKVVIDCKRHCSYQILPVPLFVDESDHIGPDLPSV